MCGSRNGAFDTSALGKRLGRRRPGLGRGPAKAPEPEPHKSPQRDAKPKKKVRRRIQGLTPPFRVHSRPTLQLCWSAAGLMCQAASACVGDALCFANLISRAGRN